MVQVREMVESSGHRWVPIDKMVHLCEDCRCVVIELSPLCCSMCEECKRRMFFLFGRK